MARRTFLGHTPPLMEFKLFPIARLLDRRVRAGAREGDLHGLLEEFEALELLDGLGGGFGAVEDDEGLALRL